MFSEGLYCQAFFEFYLTRYFSSREDTRHHRERIIYQNKCGEALQLMPGAFFWDPDIFQCGLKKIMRPEERGMCDDRYVLLVDCFQHTEKATCVVVVAMRKKNDIHASRGDTQGPHVMQNGL